LPSFFIASLLAADPNYAQPRLPPLRISITITLISSITTSSEREKTESVRLRLFIAISQFGS